MPTPTPARRVKIADFRNRYVDGGLVVEDDNGAEYVVPNPKLWPDEVIEAQQAGGDPIAIAKALIGEKNYAKFRAGGGSASIMLGMVEDEFGAAPGE